MPRSPISPPSAASRKPPSRLRARIRSPELERGECARLRLSRARPPTDPAGASQDRKSTRLNSSHLVISYAVFCLKKKIKQYTYFYAFVFDLILLLLHAAACHHENSFGVAHVAPLRSDTTDRVPYPAHTALSQCSL